MSNHISTDKIKVGVIGGGLGGLCLTIGLLQHAHLDVHVYESSDTFSEIGAAVTIGFNGASALESIAKGTREALAKCITDNTDPDKATEGPSLYIGKGPRGGERYGSLFTSRKHGTRSAHRATFLAELVSHVPADRAHLSKRCVRVVDETEERGGRLGVQVFFADGTTESFDVVIGADGVRSEVRRSLIGEQYPELVEPVFAKSCAYRGLVDMDEAVAALGPIMGGNSTMLCGPELILFNYPTDLGRKVNLIAMDIKVDKWEDKRWNVPTTRKHVASRLEGWCDAGQAWVDLLDKPNLTAWSLWEMAPLPYFNKGHIAIMGDAAHASTPFEGNGAAQAFEDAAVLTSVMALSPLDFPSPLTGEPIHPRHLIPHLLSAYDLTRRARAQKLVRTSRESGLLYSMQMPGVGEDVEKILAVQGGLFDWIWSRDIPEQNRWAQVLAHEAVGGDSSWGVLERS